MKIEELIKLEKFDEIESLIKDGDNKSKGKIKEILRQQLNSPSFGHKHEGIIPGIVADIYYTRKEAKMKMLMYKALSARFN